MHHDNLKLCVGISRLLEGVRLGLFDSATLNVPQQFNAR